AERKPRIAQTHRAGGVSELADCFAHRPRPPRALAETAHALLVLHLVASQFHFAKPPAAAPRPYFDSSGASRRTSVHCCVRSLPKWTSMEVSGCARLPRPVS